MISIAAVNAPLKGRPGRAAFSKVNVVLRASLAIFIALDFDSSAEGGNVDTSEVEAGIGAPPSTCIRDTRGDVLEGGWWGIRAMGGVNASDGVDWAVGIVN
jgi:hypothetical protein